MLVSFPGNISQSHKVILTLVNRSSTPNSWSQFLREPSTWTKLWRCHLKLYAFALQVLVKGSCGVAREKGLYGSRCVLKTAQTRWSFSQNTASFLPAVLVRYYFSDTLVFLRTQFFYAWLVIVKRSFTCFFKYFWHAKMFIWSYIIYFD